MTTICAPRFVLSAHAYDRVVEMGLDRAAVVATIEGAQTDYPGHPGRVGEERRVATRDGLAVVYAPAGALIITVLWNRKEHR